MPMACQRLDGATLKPILGIDSETVNDADGRARCVLIACSDGTHITNERGITTNAALTYITQRQGELWTFFGDYDVNFWIRDLPFTRLDRLRQTGWARWDFWRIHHIPRRLFEVWDLRTDPPRYAKVFDVYPFVQSSFVAWLESWHLTDARTIARIRSMKEQRGEFSRLSRAQILRYTQDEVRLIAAGVAVMKDRVKSGGYAPSQWLGPGAVAAHAMRKHGVKDCMPDETHALADRAYYGGRIETSRIGIVPGPLHYYDIASAYPAAMRTLPCLAHGAWKRAKPPFYKGPALCYVRWAPRDARTIPEWGPFPVRPKPGSSLRYYAQGAGWYWYDEIAPWLGSPHFTVQIGLSYEWRQECNHQPFAWVGELYYRRAELKRQGDPAEYALKLVLNSIYGKLAQKVGSKPFYCPEWAGLITARTRARLAQILVARPQDVVLVATDGVLTTRPVPNLLRPGLGGWTLDGVFGSADIWQPGFYVLEAGKLRTRGYSRVDVDPADIRRAYRAFGLQGTVPLVKEHIVGYRLATARGTLTDFCRWVRAETELSLNPLPRRWLGSKVCNREVYKTTAPHSLALERAMRIPLLERETLSPMIEDGLPDGFTRD